MAKISLFPLVFMAFFITLMSAAQDQYLNYQQLTTKLQSLSKNTNIKLESYGKSFGNKDLWVLKIGNDKNPALLIVGGIDGSHQSGTQMAVLMAEKIIQSNPEWLKNKSVFIIPSANPDAIDAYFAKTKFEKSGNNKPTDDDRNGKIADDIFDDLNNDGLITQIRIASASGDYIIDPEDTRLMIKADASKNQVGTHLVYTEGFDNNKNDLFNEDPSNGVNIDKNFAFDYSAFKPHTGEYAVSENEARVLMDFLFAHPNIHSVFTFGPHNNLSEAPKYDSKSAKERIIKSWQEQDVKFAENTSKLFNKHIKLKNVSKKPHTPGNFSNTAYYHAGKYSYSTPIWWANLESKNDTLTKKENKDAKKSELTAEQTFLKWADQEQLKDVFVDWKDIKHPDFPNQKVEVGGIKPYALQNPPMKYLEQLVDSHYTLFNDYVNHFPTHDVSEQNVENLGNNVYRITIKVSNKGFLPSYTEINDKLKFTSRVRTKLILGNNQKMLSGRKVQLENALLPNQTVEHSWLVSGNGKISIETGCATTGYKILDLNLN
jgi:hypothetical protein